MTPKVSTTTNDTKTKVTAGEKGDRDLDFRSRGDSAAMNNSADPVLVVDELEAALVQLHQAEEKEKRALADYQNVVRRSRDERVQLISLANADLIENLLQPLDHLEMAAQQLNNPGLNMVVQQFATTLQNFGLEEIFVQDLPFDVATMEVIDKEVEDGETVVTVISKGYRLNGKVIRHARVVVGTPATRSAGIGTNSN